MNEAVTERLIVGRIGAAYGIKGWVKIHSFTEPMDNLLNYGQWWIKRKGEWQPLAIDAGHRHGKGLVAHIEGVDDRNAADVFKGGEIGVSSELLSTLEDGDYYWHQLLGLQVWSSDEFLGQVDHLIETGANDVLVVRACEGSRDKRERLVPWLPESVVTSVDLNAKRIEVDWDPEF